MLKHPISRLELAIFLVLLIAAGVYAIQVNALYDFIEIAAPSNPAATNDRLYADSTAHQLKCLTSSGGSCMPSGGGGGFIQTLTAPTAGSFTQLNYNVGAGVTTTQVNNSSPVTSISILQHDPMGTNNIAALAKNKIAATFTVTTAVSIVTGAVNFLAGLWLSDGGTPPNNLFFAFQSNVGIIVPVFTSFSAFSAFAFNNLQIPPAGPLYWFRVQETASNRIYFMSADGINFAQVFTEANTAHFTTSQYGVGVEPRAASATSPDAQIAWYSFTESNP